MQTTKHYFHKGRHCGRVGAIYTKMKFFIVAGVDGVPPVLGCLICALVGSERGEGWGSSRL